MNIKIAAQQFNCTYGNVVFEYHLQGLSSFVNRKNYLTLDSVIQWPRAVFKQIKLMLKSLSNHIYNVFWLYPTNSYF